MAGVRHSLDTRRRVRDLYIQHCLSPAQISERTDVPLQTVGDWKRAAKKAGDDWDKLRLGSLTSGQGRTELLDAAMDGFLREYQFVTGVLEKMPPPESLDDIERRCNAMALLADSWAKITASHNRWRPQISKLGVALDVLQRFANFIRTEYPGMAGQLALAIEPFGRQLQKELANENNR